MDCLQIVRSRANLKTRDFSKANLRAQPEGLPSQSLFLIWGSSETPQRRQLREWDHLTDDQLELITSDNFEMKVKAVPAKKDKKGKVLVPAVPAHIKTITKDVVVVKDVEKHLEWVVEQRGMERSSVKVKVYIDSGEGSCKVLATVMDENHDPEVMDTKLEQPGNRLAGVNRVLVLAYVEGLQETHKNMETILVLLNFKEPEL